jgi:hypothetical protein
LDGSGVFLEGVGFLVEDVGSMLILAVDEEEEVCSADGM